MSVRRCGGVDFAARRRSCSIAACSVNVESRGYLQSLGITKIDYHIASHYHSDHIGCVPTVLRMFPLQKFVRSWREFTTAMYRPMSPRSVGSGRPRSKGQTITLDASSANPVTITFVALNGNGVSTSDENDLEPGVGRALRPVRC